MVYHNTSRLAAASDSLPGACPWSVVLSASSTTQTGRHDIAEILLKVVLNTKIKSDIEGIIHLFKLSVDKYSTHVIVFLNAVLQPLKYFSYV